MVYQHKTIPVKMLRGHIHSLELLASEKNVMLTFELCTYDDLIEEFGFTHFTEFILLLTRIINQLEPKSEVVIRQNNQENENQKSFYSIKCTNSFNPKATILYEGLDLNTQVDLDKEGINIDLMLPQEICTEIQQQQESSAVEKRVQHRQPFFQTLRENLKSHYTTFKNLHEDAIRMSLEDGKFVELVNKIILKNLDNPLFDANSLSIELGLSRSQVYRKLKLLVRRSPATYIRYTRLMKAKDDLENTNFTIGDIAFEVGYTDQSHFTRAFKKQFGFKPSFYRHQCKDNLKD